MGAIRKWWATQTQNRKLAWGTVGLAVATGAIKWLIDRAATLAYETFLEAFVSAERASAMKAGLTERIVWLSEILSDRLVTGVLLGFALLGIAILALPPIGRALSRLLAVMDAARRSFLAKAGKYREIARLAFKSRALAKRTIGLLYEYQAKSFRLPPPLDAASEDERARAWHETTQRHVDDFASVMAYFRSEIHSESRFVLIEMQRLGYLTDLPHAIDRATNTFCMEAIAHALTEGAEAIFRDLRSRGFTEDQLQSFAPQSPTGSEGRTQY